jgi:hypothetical protein
MKNLLLAASALLLCISCNEMHDKAKETIDQKTQDFEVKANELVDSTLEDVKNSVDKAKNDINTALSPDVVLSEGLKAKGVSTGKFIVESDKKGKNNKLVLYIITEKDFNGKLTLKVLDSNKEETGRQILSLNSKAGQAGYQEIVFDERTTITNNSTIQID